MSRPASRRLTAGNLGYVSAPPASVDAQGNLSIGRPLRATYTGDPSMRVARMMRKACFNFTVWPAEALRQIHLIRGHH